MMVQIFYPRFTPDTDFSDIYEQTNALLKKVTASDIAIILDIIAIAIDTLDEETFTVLMQNRDNIASYVMTNPTLLIKFIENIKVKYGDNSSTYATLLISNYQYFVDIITSIEAIFEKPLFYEEEEEISLLSSSVITKLSVQF